MISFFSVKTYFPVVVNIRQRFIPAFERILSLCYEQQFPFVEKHVWPVKLCDPSLRCVISEHL